MHTQIKSLRLFYDEHAFYSRIIFDIRPILFLCDYICRL